MLSSPAITAALADLPSEPEPFSQRAINALFRACITAAGHEWETPRSLVLFDRLWHSDSVISGIEALQETHDASLDTAIASRELLSRIEDEIREAD